MWSLINVSSNLHTTDVKLTGIRISDFYKVNRSESLVLGSSTW